MIVVLDASAAVRTVVDVDPSFETAAETAELILAPELIVAEVCNSLRKYMRARLISPSQACTFTEGALSLVDRMHSLKSLLQDVLPLTSQTDISTYDLFYVALARKTGATLVTADRALRRNAVKLGISVNPGAE